MSGGGPALGDGRYGKEVPCWGIEEGKPADINLSKGHYRKILKCGILACKDNYRGIIYDSEKKEY